MTTGTLRQRVVAAVGWTLGIKLLMQMLTWAMTLLVIRILTPDDYGLMAISQVFLNAMLGLASMGLGDALIQARDTAREVVARVFGVTLLAAVALTLALLAASYPIAAWYNDTRLVALIQVASLGFVLNALGMLPRAFMMKSLLVRQVFIVEVASGVVGAGAVLALAYGGHGVWALMLGWLAGGLVRLAGLMGYGRAYLVMPRLGWGGVAPLFSFGAYRALDSLAWIVATSIDVLIIGRLLGPAAVGLYSVALNFAMLPLSKVTPIINATAFPAFALAQERPADARYYLLKSMRLMALVAVPVFFGMAAVAPEVVALVFGPRWSDAAPVLAILSLAAVLRAIPVPVPTFLQGIGDSAASFWCSAVGIVLLAPAMLVGCRWGVEGAAWAWCVVAPVHYVIVVRIVAQRGRMAMAALLLVPVRPVLAGLAMLAVVALARWVSAEWASDLTRLALLVTAGVISYAGAVALLMREAAGEIRGLLRRSPG